MLNEHVKCKINAAHIEKKSLNVVKLSNNFHDVNFYYQHSLLGF